jgi:hypothetical protein
MIRGVYMSFTYIISYTSRLKRGFGCKMPKIREIFSTMSELYYQKIKMNDSKT